MSERHRKKRKDATWTKEELSATLHKGTGKAERKERRSKPDSETTVERRSKRDDVILDDDRSSRRKKRDEYETHDKERRSERKERRKTGSDLTLEESDEHVRARRKAEKEMRREERKRAEIDEDEYRKEKERRRREKELRRQQRQKEDEEALLKERRHRGTPERKHRSDEHVAEKEKKHRSRSERERKLRYEDYDDEKERRHSGRSDRDRKHRTEDYDEEKERRRRERKEEKRKRELEQQLSETRSHSKSNVAASASGRGKKSKEVDNTSTNVDEDQYNYDDEEFEDYEDDFEDDENEDGEADESGTAHSTEVNEIIRAIARENERVASARTLSSRSEQEASNTSDTESASVEASRMHTTSINFFAAKKTQQGDRIRKKMLKRRKDLAALVQLDFISFDLLELPPVTEYDFYIKSFGTRNSRQVSTQCNDDALDIDIQTDSPEVIEKWTQHPQDGPLACGGGASNSESRSALDISKSVLSDGQAFSNFINYAYEIVEASFVEATIWSGSASDRKSCLSCCASSVQFNHHISYLQGRSILLAAFGEGMVAVAFSAAGHDFSARVDRKCLVTVWKLTHVDNPHKVLVCDAKPTSCCFSPSNKDLLFVGTDDGCVLAYDLLEPSTMHQKFEVEKKNVAVMRGPTFTTAWISETHTSPIVCVNALSADDSSNQIFSLEEDSRICVWLVVDVISDVDDDVGLVPHGHVKLVKGLTLVVPGSARSTCAACLDSKTFFIGNSNGCVVSMTRDKQLMTYDSLHVGEVNSLAFSRLSSVFMLTAHNDGSVCLFHTKQGSPIMTWCLGQVSVLRCDWSNRRSAVFFALDSSNQFHVWDLMATDSAPAVSNSLDKKAMTFCVEQRSENVTNLLLAFESCDFEVHRVSPHFTESVTNDETERMASTLVLFA